MQSLRTTSAVVVLTSVSASAVVYFELHVCLVVTFFPVHFIVALYSHTGLHILGMSRDIASLRSSNLAIRMSFSTKLEL